jgi:hypothetical protein
MRASRRGGYTPAVSGPVIEVFLWEDRLPLEQAGLDDLNLLLKARGFDARATDPHGCRPARLQEGAWVETVEAITFVWQSLPEAGLGVALDRFVGVVIDWIRAHVPKRRPEEPRRTVAIYGPSGEILREVPIDSDGGEDAE